MHHAETKESIDLRAFTALLWTIVLLLAASPLCGCGKPTRAEWTELAYPTAHEYPRTYEITGTTPGGVRYDDRVGGLDRDRLDTIVERVYGCLGTGERIDPQSLAAGAQCLHREWSTPSREDFVVVIEPETRVGCGTVHGSEVSEWYRHFAKDTTPGLDCPPAWRALFREADDGTGLIIVTPSLNMLGDVLTRWSTMCRNPWVSDFPKQVCASPATSEHL